MNIVIWDYDEAFENVEDISAEYGLEPILVESIKDGNMAYIISGTRAIVNAVFYKLNEHRMVSIDEYIIGEELEVKILNILIRR